MLERSLLCIGVVLGLLLAGCDAPNPDSGPAPAPVVTATAVPYDAENVAATFGGQVLSVDELVVELQKLPLRSRQMMDPAGRARFVENHILHRLLYEEGLARGLADDPEIRTQVEDLNRRLVVQALVRELQDVPAVTDEEIEAYYEGNASRYSTSTLRARHILVREEELAEDLRAQLTEAPDTFAELAREHSVDTASARKGGDLGFFGHGRMVPPFEAAAFALEKPGDLSDVVKTQYGFHIIKLEERRDGQKKPLDQVQEQIRATLRHEAIQKRTQDYYEELKRKADVQLHEDVIEHTAANLPEPSPGTGRKFRGGH